MFCNGADIGNHFSRNRGDHKVVMLAFINELFIALAEPELCFPCDINNLFW